MAVLDSESRSPITAVSRTARWLRPPRARGVGGQGVVSDGPKEGRAAAPGPGRRCAGCRVPGLSGGLHHSRRTLIPIDRVAGQRRYYSGERKRHGMNVQVLTDPAGRLVWASPHLAGAVQGLSAARISDRRAAHVPDHAEPEAAMPPK